MKRIRNFVFILSAFAICDVQAQSAAEIRATALKVGAEENPPIRPSGVPPKVIAPEAPTPAKVEVSPQAEPKAMTTEAPKALPPPGMENSSKGGPQPVKQDGKGSGPALATGTDAGKGGVGPSGGGSNSMTKSATRNTMQSGSNSSGGGGSVGVYSKEAEKAPATTGQATQSAPSKTEKTETRKSGAKIRAEAPQ